MQVGGSAQGCAGYTVAHPWVVPGRGLDGKVEMSPAQLPYLEGVCCRKKLGCRKGNCVRAKHANESRHAIPGGEKTTTPRGKPTGFEGTGVIITYLFRKRGCDVWSAASTWGE